MKNIMDQIEEELDRCMKEEGKMIEAIFLGKDEIERFMDELLTLNGTPISDFDKEKEEMRECDIIIDCYENSKIKVHPTNNKNEIRFTYKSRLLN